LSQETTLELTQQDGLLEALLGCLLGVLRRGLDDNGQLDGDSPAIHGAQQSACGTLRGAWYICCAAATSWLLL